MSEKLTYNQVNEQQSAAYINQSNENPTVLIPRKDGRITTGRLDTSTHKVHFTEDNQSYEKSVSPEAMSDQVQEKLAEALADTALRSEVGIDHSGFAMMFDPDAPDDLGAAAVYPEEDLATKARAAADYKYNQVMAATGNIDAAQKAADRVWKNFKL